MKEEKNSPTLHLSKVMFESFQQFLVEASGLHFTKDRKDFLEQKLLERMVLSKHPSYENYFYYLTSSPEGKKETQDLLDVLTIGETYFSGTNPILMSLKTMFCRS